MTIKRGAGGGVKILIFVFNKIAAYAGYTSGFVFQSGRKSSLLSLARILLSALVSILET